MLRMTSRYLVPENTPNAELIDFTHADGKVVKTEKRYAKIEKEVTSAAELPEPKIGNAPLPKSNSMWYSPVTVSPKIGKLLSNDVTGAFLSLIDPDNARENLRHTHTMANEQEVSTDSLVAYVMSTNAKAGECECKDSSIIPDIVMGFVNRQHTSTVTVSPEVILQACNQAKTFPATETLGHKTVTLPTFCISLNGSFRYAATNDNGGMVGEYQHGDAIDNVNVVYSHDGDNVTLKVNAKQLAEAITFLCAFPVGVKREKATKRKIGTVAPLVTIQTQGSDKPIVLSVKWDSEPERRYAVIMPFLPKSH